jgi:hypothetical protein
MKNIIGLGLVVSLLSMNALAWGRDEGRRDSRGGDRNWRGNSRGEMHHYRNDHWVRNTWFGLATVAVGALAMGAMIDSLPPRYTTVVVGREAYYYYDGCYFRPAPGGYVVVPAPVVSQPVYVTPPPAPVVYINPPPVVMTSTAPVQAPAPAQAAPPPQAPAPAGQDTSSVTINIPNDKGNYTPVTLRRSGTGFIGPQNEYYPEFPRVEQLRLMYGK